MAVNRSLISLLICCISVCGVMRAAERDGVLQMKSNSPNAPVVAVFRSRAQRIRRQASGSRLTEEQRQDFLTAHNNYRSAVNPPAANMKKMVWDDELASMAQEWADNCVWKHGQPERDNPPYNPIGQNNFATTATTTTGSEATKRWYDEVSDYHFDDNSCNSGKVCGHYTQVVWANSDHLGCAIADCDPLENSRLGHSQFVVCNYGPAGNFIGASPYTKGEFCSACPAGTSCQSNLCVKVDGDKNEGGGGGTTEGINTTTDDGDDNSEGGEGDKNEGGGGSTTEGINITTDDGDDNSEGGEGDKNEGGGGSTTEGITTTTDDGDDDCFFFCPRQAGYVAAPIKWLYAVVSILVLSNIFG